MPFFSGRCYSERRLDGLTAIITGCNTGIGKQTAIDFYKRGARVIMACRDTTKAKTAKQSILKEHGATSDLGQLIVIKLDLNSLKSVRECADTILETEPKINLLVNNAGVICPASKTIDGFETQLGTNHYAHFLFTLLLLPRLINSKPARIVNVSSRAHYSGTMDFDDLHYERKPYNAFQAYCQSKLANVLFTKELAKRLKENNIEGVNVYSLHPGAICTELGRHLDQIYFPGFRFLMSAFGFLFKSVEMGAQTTIYCSIDEKTENESGLYYSDCVAVDPSAEALNPEVAAKLWDISIKAVGLEDTNPFTTNDDKLKVLSSVRR